MGKKIKPLNILESIKSTYWHMLPSAVENLINIANRDNDVAKYEALLARDGEPLENSQKTIVRNGTAIIPINGPIFRKANLFTAISGATSQDVLATDFTKALEDPTIKAIILDIDSPGGSAQGLSELSDMIFNARGQKPIISFVNGMAASAAFFIGSAADQMIVAREALVGAIGTITNVTDTSKADAKDGIEEIRFTSKISPKKNLPLSSKEGKEQLQNIVDQLGEIFVSAVARNRGVSEDTVLNDFGQGDVLIGQSAVDAGMVDSVGTLEGVLSKLDNKNNLTSQETFTNGGPNMKPDDIKKITLSDLQNHNPELVETIKATVDVNAAKAEGKAEGILAENTRIKAIESIKNTSNEKLVDSFKFDSSLDKGAAALKVLEAQNTSDKNLGTNIMKDAEDLAGNLSNIQDPATSDENKAEEKKALLSNMVSGANTRRQPNMKIYDKVNINK